jgi:hypothetical protein
MNKVGECYLSSIMRRHYFSIIFNEKVHTLLDEIWYLLNGRVAYDLHLIACSLEVGGDYQQMYVC